MTEEEARTIVGDTISEAWVLCGHYASGMCPDCCTKTFDTIPLETLLTAKNAILMNHQGQPYRRDDNNELRPVPGVGYWFPTERTP